MRDRLVLCGSASKAYAMTGWRCGWVVGAKPVIQAANALQSHTTSNVNSITQKAAVAALTGPQQCVTDMLTEYQRRRDQVIAWLAEEPRLRCAVPQGAFYLFPDVSDFLSPDGCRTSLDFADALLKRGTRRHDGRRGVRHARLHPPVVRDVARSTARGRDAVDKVRGTGLFPQVRPPGAGGR